MKSILNNTSFQNENLKMILTVITILIVIFALVGNYYVGNYRLNAMEKKMELRETKEDLREDRIKKLEVELSSINTKLDFLIEQYKK